MSEIIEIFPYELILLTVTIVILPTIIAGLLRHALYRYLINSANKVSRLLKKEIPGKQPGVVRKLEDRFRQASQNLEQVNTIALIDGLYSQETFNFFGLSLRCEPWDYFCRTFPNLLLAFGLLGTFIGISFNLYNLSETISQTGTNDLNNLVSQLQVPLKNMGIAFFSSLVAILCSSILIIINSRCNTNFAKSQLITSLEDYLDNIYKIDVQGDTRLDKAVDRMVRQQQEFLERFHIKVGQVLETTIGKAANKMVKANEGFQDNVNDITTSMAESTKSFQAMTNHLETEIKTVSEIVPKFTTAADKIESSSNLYLEGAEKIEASKFSENLESLTADLATTQKSFSQSTVTLENQVQKLAETQQKTTQLAQQVYTQLDTASNKLENSSTKFSEAAKTFNNSEFANKLTTATNELVTIPQQFNNSTAILHETTNSLNTAINNINTASGNTNNLVEEVNSLNQNSTDLLKQSDHNIKEEIASLNNIKGELKNVVNTLNEHKSQINTSISNFNETILTSFQKQSENNIVELKELTAETKNNLKYLQDTKTKTTELITILEKYNNNFNTINTSLSTLAKTSEQQGKQVNSNLNGIGMTSDRLLKTFEDRSKNNIKEIQKLITEFKNLISEFEKHEQQMNNNINELNNNISNKANQQITTYNQQIQQITEKFNKIL